MVAMVAGLIDGVAGTVTTSIVAQVSGRARVAWEVQGSSMELLGWSQGLLGILPLLQGLLCPL